MADAKNYSGGCHCGQIRYDVTTDLTTVAQCNCSICQKRGALWTFVPVEQFRTAGRQRRSRRLPVRQEERFIIYFCPQCGVGSFSRGNGAERPGDGRGQCPLSRRYRHQRAHDHAVRRAELVGSRSARFSDLSRTRVHLRFRHLAIMPRMRALRCVAPVMYGGFRILGRRFESILPQVNSIANTRRPPPASVPLPCWCRRRETRSQPQYRPACRRA